MKGLQYYSSTDLQSAETLPIDSAVKEKMW